MDSSIVLFDGVCNLCNGAVQFIIDRDPWRRFRFAPLQSNVGRRLLEEHGLNPETLSTLVLVESDRAYTKSSAALRIARRLRFPWPVAAIGLVVPWLLRDLVYDFIAGRRYRWFGKAESCRMPTPELRERFLNET